MSSWIGLTPALLLVTAVMVVPGLAVLRAAGVRGLLLLTLAPAVSGGVVAVATVAGGQLGIRWSPLVLAGATLAIAVGAFGVTRLGPLRQSLPRGGGGPRRLAVLTAGAVTVVAIPALALQARRLLRAMGSPDAITQSYDTVFHLNAVAFISDTGDASPLAMTMGTPDRATSFYPTLFHAVAALAHDVTGVGVAESVNALSLVVVLLVWPASLLALARAVFGPRPLLLAATGALAFAFPQFPNRMLSFGVLYPNLISYAMAPAVLALVVLALRRGRLAWVTPTLLTLLTGVGVLVAHPNGMVALLMLVPVPVVLAAVHATRRHRAHGGGWGRVGAMWLGVALMVAGILVLFLRVPMLASMRRAAYWAVQGTVPEAILGVLDLSTPSIALVGQPGETGEPQPLLALLVLVGIVVALRVRAWRWLPISYAVAAGLWVVAAAWDHPLRGVLTGYWYTDAIRLAALLPMLAIPLAALGVLGLARLAGLVGRRAVRREAASTPLPGARHLRRPPAGRAQLIGSVVVVAVMIAGTTVAGRQPATRDSFETLAWIFTIPDLVDDREREFLDEVGDLVPPGSAVLTNPWDGGSLVWALEDRVAVFPNINSTKDEPRAILAQGLVQAGEDPRVCEAVDDLGARYVLHLTGALWSADHPSAPHLGFPGLYGLEEAGVARVLASDGENQLLEITACD